MALLQPGIELPFANGFYDSRSKQLSTQRCVNYYPAIHQAPTLTPETLYFTAGIDEDIPDNGTGHARGGHKVDGKPYIVKNDRLYRIDRVVNPDLSEEFTEVDLGAVPGSGRVIMRSGLSGTGFDLCIVEPGVSAYSYNTSTGIITDLLPLTNFRGPVNDVIHVNGIFTFLQTDTNTLFHSNVNDILTYEALSFEVVTAVDKAVGLMKYRNRLFLMGDDITIPYNYIGGANFVWAAQVNAAIDSGLRAVHAKANIRQAYVYLGVRDEEEAAIWLYNGGTPQKISTEPLDFLIENLTETELDNAFFMAYAQSGSENIVFVAGNECFVFDLNSGRWHERRSYIDPVDARWRVNVIISAYNRLIVGDSNDGRIGHLDDTVRTEYGLPVFRSFTLQPFDNKGKFIHVKRIILVMDAGFGGEVNHDWSDDGGYTWADGEIESAGEIGEYGRSIEWSRQGSTPFSRVLRFGTSSDAPCNVNKVLALA